VHMMRRSCLAVFFVALTLGGPGFAQARPWVSGDSLPVQAAAKLHAGIRAVRANDGGRLNAQAGSLFVQRHLTGAMAMQDVKTGVTLVAISVGAGPAVGPLSTTKLLLAASYWEERNALSVQRVADPRALVALGSDSAGRQLALQLRHAVGSVALLRELDRFGFPPCGTGRTENCTSLSPNDTDVQWADAMSIGETGFRVTPLGLSRFLRAIALDGMSGAPRSGRIVHFKTAMQLQSAMIDTVRLGTASGIRDRLGALGGIGGKTGSGPGGARPLDGIFAGLVFDHKGTPRYTVVTYVRRGGVGGGAAADISAAMATRRGKLSLG
jgi:hypothetical protein